jgi:N-acetylmuramoyl-L-alanine amidase
MEKIILNKKILILFIILLFNTLLFSGNDFSNSTIRKGELNLYFSSKIERVSYFSIPIKDGLTKYVYDIYGATLPLGKGISGHSYKTIKSFRMAQNTPHKLRVVIVSGEKALDKHVYSGNHLAIPLKHGQESILTGTSLSSRMVTKKVMSMPSSKIVETPQKRPSPNTATRHYTIVIDAGHGGKDNGASCCNDKKEKKVTLSVAEKLKRKLETEGYKVYMTREDDSFVKLPTRTEFANSKKADIFISIHANAAPNKKLADIFKGIEVYYLSPAKTDRAKEAAAKENAVLFKGKDFYTKNAYLSLISREKIIESHKLGLDVSAKMLSNIRSSYGKVDDGGVKPANFWVLVGAQMPAILVETGYITHPKEGSNLMNAYYKDLLAKGISEGIGRYLDNK